LEDISAAFKKIMGDIERTGRQGQKALSPLKNIATELKGLLPAIGFAAAVTGLTALAKSALATADSMGKAAQRTGTTAETFSTLAFAANGADLSTEGLETAMIQLARSMGEAEKGTGAQADALKRLGIDAKELEGLDTGEAFIKVATALGKVEDGTNKTRIATQLFGKAGSQAIVLANDLATNGYGAIQAAAEELGLVISTDTANAAAVANDAFNTLKNQTKGLALQFIEGLAPSIVDTMTTFTDATAGQGVKSMKTFGEFTGRAIRGIIGTFRILVNVVKGVFATIGDYLGGTAASWAAIFRGDFSEAVNIWKNTQIDAARNVKDVFVGVFNDVGQLAEDVSRDPPEIKVKVRPQVEVADIEDTDERKAREKAAKEAEKEAKRLAKERAQAEKEATQAIFDLEQRLMEARGQGREAQIAKLEEELAQQRKILEAAGMLNAETEDLLNQVRQFGTLQIDFGNLSDNINREMDAFERAREQIESDVQTGVATTLDGERRLLELEQSRLPIMKEMVIELQKQAALLGSPEAIAEAERLSLAIDQIALSVRNATQPLVEIREAGLDGFEQGVKNVLTNLEEFESVEDVFKSLARTVGQSLQQILADMLAAYLRAVVLKALLSSFGGGSGAAANSAAGSLTSTAPGVTVATGGHIRGPGTTTSDSIPAWLSDGEYVVRAKAVAQPGVLDFLHYLNRNTKLPSRSSPRFAEGGIVAAPAGAGGPGRNIRIMNVIDPKMTLDALGTPEGEEVVLNIIERNPSRVRRSL
jgi:hypothetical protein